MPICAGGADLAGVSGVGLAQHSVAVPGHHLAGLQSLVCKLLHLVSAGIITQLQISFRYGAEF